ncbi:MAG: peptidase MA family metallohydrolase [Elusimicrobia bacterium]|nr:peptidase MA family metallohydrolase [Elusimicrobiota bacterium]
MLHALLLPALLSLPAAAGDGAPAAIAWHKKVSPHFIVFHESAWSPNSTSLELERMYAAMRLNLAMFAPWMVKEKTKVYIYSSQQSYLAGEFAPPRWSKGLAFVSKKTIVVYDPEDQGKLKAVIAHELTHLYFEGYFAEKLKYPPQWLNEGLAVYMEESVFPDGGAWSRALAYFPRERRIPFDSFFATSLDGITGDSRIADWYLQSYGVVMYLYQPHKRVQFKAFCDEVRDGETVDMALWKNYRAREGDDFGAKWTAWLDSWTAPSKGGLQPRGPSASFNFKPVQLSSFTFTEFGKKR